MMNPLFNREKKCRVASIVFALALGLFLFSACSSDTVQDLVKDVVDIDFDKNADIKLDDVTARKTVEVAPSAVSDGCDSTSVSAGLALLEDEIENLDIVDIADVELRYVNASYTATWDPAEVTTLSCSLSITGITTPAQTALFEETVINSPSGVISYSLTPEQNDVINFFLTNRDEPFEYCLSCQNADAINSYEVTYSVEIGVTVTGNI